MVKQKVSPDEKALSYIAAGKVSVERVDRETNTALLHIASSTQNGDPYYVEFNGHEWTCDCPARVLLCVHIRAAQKIVKMEKKTPSLSGNAFGTSWVTEFLSN